MSKLGPFDDEGEFARGAFGEVHRGLDPQMRRRVAVKVLQAHLASDDRVRRRFVAEAQIGGQLEHPNIVPVYQMGEVDGRPYLAMREVRGDTLEDRIAKAEDPLDPPVLSTHIQIVLRVCDAIAYAHDRGVAHLDVKPSNILVGRFKRVYLMDWGLARLVDPDHGEALDVPDDPDASIGEEELLGSAAYMAPEQARQERTRCGTRTDIFLLGATLWHVVTGQPPYPGRALPQQMYKAAYGKREDIRTVAPGRLPADLVGIIDKAMALEPEDRYASVLELQADLESFLHGGWHLPIRDVAAGEALYEVGDAGDAAYIVQAGRFEMQADGDTLEVLGPGDVFGEVAVLTGRPRTSSVRAVEDGKVLVVARDVLHSGLGVSSWMGRFVTALADRFQEADARLRDVTRAGITTIAPGDLEDW